MLNLIVLVLIILVVLACVHFIAKLRIKTISQKADELLNKTLEKTARLQKLERVTNEKLYFLNYAESITNFSDDCIAIMNTDIFLYVNPKMLNLLGYSKEEMIKKSWINFVALNDKTKIIDATDATTFTSLKYFIIDFICKDGSKIAIWWTLTKQDKNGLVYATGKDVSCLASNEHKLDKFINKTLLRMIEKNGETI